MDTDKKLQKQQTNQIALKSIVPAEVKSSSSDFELRADKLANGFITHIRMGHVSEQSVAYARFQPSTGAVHPISPVGLPTKIKKPLFAESTLLSPNASKPCTLGGIFATTPLGKTKLSADKVIGDIFTPKGKTQHQIIRLCDQDEKQQKVKTENELSLVEFKKQFKLEASKLKSKSSSSLPEFRGGTTLLTAEDVKYRSSKNINTGGHRSLFSQPRQVMSNQSAKEVANELDLCNGDFLSWDWGHLLPAGGSAQGVEVNLDPYNFVAVPATLNTWQMVPEMMARHLAQSGFVVVYTAEARTEPMPSGEFSYVAKEIYCSVKLEHHGLIAEFFTTREDHAKPLITDAVHMLSEFYKVANKPVPKDLKEKFEKELNEKLAEMKETFPPESFISPVKTHTAKQLPYLEKNATLLFSPTLNRMKLKELKNKDALKAAESATAKPKKKSKSKPEAKVKNKNKPSVKKIEEKISNTKKRPVPDTVESPKEESISKRTRSAYK